jgi:hypothetical protein
MNIALPPGDRGHRSPDSGRASGPAGLVPGAVGLVCGVAVARKESVRHGAA